jgi:hypothetical protein
MILMYENEMGLVLNLYYSFRTPVFGRRLRNPNPHRLTIMPQSIFVKIYPVV